MPVIGRLPRGFATTRVSTISWERHSLAQQMAAACAAHVLIAAHGAGNEWAHFLHGARPEKAALLELALQDWGNCQYSKNLLRRGCIAECQTHPRLHPERKEFWSGVKIDDVVVHVENVTHGVARLMERLDLL